MVKSNDLARWETSEPVIELAYHLERAFPAVVNNPPTNSGMQEMQVCDPLEK